MYAILMVFKASFSLLLRLGTAFTRSLFVLPASGNCGALRAQLFAVRALQSVEWTLRLDANHPQMFAIPVLHRVLHASG